MTRDVVTAPASISSLGRVRGLLPAVEESQPGSLGSQSHPLPVENVEGGGRPTLARFKGQSNDLGHDSGDSSVRQEYVPAADRRRARGRGGAMFRAA